MSGAVVLAYHAVGTCPRGDDRHNLFVDPDSFNGQMEFLARRRTVVSLEAAVRRDLPAAALAVAITFDDAYVNVLENAAPVLERLALPATVFAPTSFLGARNTSIAPTTCDVDIMDEDQLRAAESCAIRVESHGHDHIDMATSSSDGIAADLDASKRSIERITGHSADFLAYPFGRHSRTAREAAEAAGFSAAFTIDEEHGGRYAFERVQITPLDGDALFALKTSGRYAAIRRSPAVARAYSLVRPLVRRALRG